MKVNADQIIRETIEAFNQSVEQKNKFALLTDLLDSVEYKELHSSPLVPLEIKIDIDAFCQEITKFDHKFQQWGSQHTNLPRYGLSIVNKSGKLIENDPINGSLFEWNKSNPSVPLFETDCTMPTEVLNLPSLAPLSVFNNYWARSNILKWGPGGEFKPHIDAVIPTPWIRLWGTTDYNNCKLRFYNNATGLMEIFENVDPGRLYIIDTTLVHDAYNNEGIVYQFFLSVFPSAKNIIKGLINV